MDATRTDDLPGLVERLRDVKGREIQEGDLLRSPHFRGGRRKMFYLYHVVVRRGDHLWMVPACHLAGEPYVKGGGDCLLKYNAMHAEIIDGHTNGWWYDRPRNVSVIALAEEDRRG